MKVETIKQPVSELAIPGNKSENPLMIETPGMPMGSPTPTTMKTYAGPSSMEQDNDNEEGEGESPQIEKLPVATPA